MALRTILATTVAVSVAASAWRAVHALPATATTQGYVNGAGLDVLTFDSLPAGTILSEAFGRFGSGPVGVEGTNPRLGAVNAAVVFDSDAPSGGDPDLGSPNEDFGGPGIGKGGSQGSPYQNDRRLNQILIVANDLVDQNGDGLVDDPDDAAVLGASIELDFAALGAVTVQSIDLIDLERRPSPTTIELFDDNGSTLALFNAPILGDNGLTQFDLGGVCNVARMVVTLNGSGAIDNVVFDPTNRGGSGSIGDFIWNDENGDGLQDPGETGLAGVSVSLKDASGQILATVQTGNSGFYEFPELCAGDYTVEVDESTLPPDFVPSPCNVGQDDTIDNDCSPAFVTLPSDETEDDTIDFGYTQPCNGTIGNYVWLDLNGNHVQDPQENGINQIGLLLRDDMGVLIGTTQTSEAGFYEFGGLCAGTYFVDIDESTVPAGLEIVLCDVGEDDTVESDCRPVRVVLDNSGAADITIDFGFAVCAECVTCESPGDDDDDGGVLDGSSSSGGSGGSKSGSTKSKSSKSSSSSSSGSGSSSSSGGCKGGATGLTLRYLGGASAFVEVRNQADPSELFFQDVVEPNGTFTFFGKEEQGEVQPFPPDLVLIVDGMQDAILHTSCSQPLGPGIVVGTFLIEAVDGTEQGIVCKPNAIVCTTGAPASLALRYTGASCRVERGRRAASLLSCFGDPESAATVRVFVYDEHTVWYDDLVELDGVFTFEAAAAGKRRLSDMTWVDVYDARSGELLQGVVFDSSCSQALVVGDRFGGLELEGLASDL